MTALVFLLMALVLPGSFGSRLLNADGDLARHLRQGREILESGGVIRTDIFSWTRPGEPYVSFEYGTQIVFGLVERAAGLAGIVLLASLLLAATHALLTRYLLRRGVDPLLALLVAAFSAMVAQVHWIARPHLVTLLLSVVLLEWIDRERPGPWWKFTLLFLVWANLHAGFIFGLCFMALWLAGDVLEGWLNPDRRAEAWVRARLLVAALIPSSLVTLANAYGPVLHLHAFGNLGDEYMKDHTVEFMSPDFHGLGPRFFLAALLAILAGALWSRRAISLAHLFAIVATIGLSLLAGRNISLFALTGLPLATVFLAPWWNRLRGSRLTGFSATASLGSTTPWVAAVAASFLILGLARGTLAGRQVVPDAFEEPSFPVTLVAEARAAGLAGRLFNDFRYGGYLQYAWPEQKVFIDGATDVYGGQHQRKHTNVLAMVPGWRDSLDHWGVDLVLVPVRQPMASELVREGGWGVWRCDGTAVLLQRTADPVNENALPGCIHSARLPSP